MTAKSATKIKAVVVTDAQTPAVAAVGADPAVKLDEAGGVSDPAGTPLPDAVSEAVPAPLVDTASDVGGRADPDEYKIWPTPPTVVVQGPAKGRWRIGRNFGPEPVSIQATDLTETEFNALRADPELFVTVVDAPH